MATGKHGPDDVRLLIDGFDISGDSFELALTKEAGIETPSEGFGDAWQEGLATGVDRGGVTHRSFYDDVAAATEAALVGNQGTSRVLLAILGGNVQGASCVAFSGAMQRNVVRSPVRGELHKIAAEYMSDGEIDEPPLLQSLSAEAGDGVTSDGSLNNTTFSSNGGPGYLEVTSLTLGGYTSVTVAIQESSNDGGGDAFVDIITFAAVTVAQVAERLTVAALATVEQYLRVILTWNGAGSSESITLAVAFERD